MQAIEVTGQTAGNSLIEDAMADVIESVKSGGSIAAPLRDATIFPSMVAQMIAVGEETGNLDTMLTKVADFYEDEVAAAIKALTSILEPIMIVLVGGIVGFIVIAMYMPMFKVYDSDQVALRPLQALARRRPPPGGRRRSARSRSAVGGTVRLGVACAHAALGPPLARPSSRTIRRSSSPRAARPARSRSTCRPGSSSPTTRSTSART